MLKTPFKISFWNLHNKSGSLLHSLSISKVLGRWLICPSLSLLHTASTTLAEHAFNSGQVHTVAKAVLQSDISLLSINIKDFTVRRAASPFRNGLLRPIHGPLDRLRPAWRWHPSTADLCSVRTHCYEVNQWWHSHQSSICTGGLFLPHNCPERVMCPFHLGCSSSWALTGGAAVSESRRKRCKHQISVRSCSHGLEINNTSTITAEWCNHLTGWTEWQGWTVSSLLDVDEEICSVDGILNVCICNFIRPYKNF